MTFSSKAIIHLLAPVVLFASLPAWADDSPKPRISEATQACIDCHVDVTPGIVEDWKTSRHSRTTFTSALKLPELERRVSAKAVAADLQAVVVGCYECHNLNGPSHADTFDHFDYQIHVVVSPNDCKTCHPTEVEEYSRSKKAHANGNLAANPTYHALVEAVDGVKKVEKNGLAHYAASDTTKADTCFGCHGTEVKVDGMITRETDVGDIQVPHLTNWPNQGVGRINPDGSFGACTACHPRHSFSIEIARKPYTCLQCHLEPDVPAWNVYQESKHGNIFQSVGQEWNWDAVPWTVGKDFKAPTCATCHNSLLVGTGGEVIAKRSHDFGSRLWVRIMGFPYSHPQPKSGDTSIIRNKDGQALPTAFTGEPASEFLIDAQEQVTRKKTMMTVCKGCHGSTWVEGHFDRFDATVKEADQMVLSATQLMQQAWEKGLADPANPFDEALEMKWVKQWLFYANSVRYAAAMSGPDYGTFKNGWWSLTENLAEMHKELEEAPLLMKEKKKK